MAVSTEVELPRSHVAVFPRRCVVCGCEWPNSQSRIVTYAVGWQMLVFFTFGWLFQVKVPTCRLCGWKLQALRMTNLLASVLLLALVLNFGWPYLKSIESRNLRRIATVGLIAVCFIPKFVFDHFFSLPFNVVPYSKTVEYAFTNEGYALVFAVQNRDAEWVKINGDAVDWDEDVSDEEESQLDDGREGEWN